MKALLKSIIVSAGCRGWLSERAASRLISLLKLKYV